MIWGPMTQYTLYYYSNYNGKAIDIYSPSQLEDEEGMPIPVLDEAGNPVLDSEGFECYWGGTGLCKFDENWNTIPVHMELSAEKLPLAETPAELPVPEGQFVWNYDDDVEYGGVAYHKVFDLGYTEPGNILVGQNYDEMMAAYGISDPTMAGMWDIAERYESYELVPMTPSAGEIRVKATTNHPIWGPMTQYVLIKYSDYYYGGGIALYSPSQWEDEEGNAIPVLDADGEPVLDDNGDPCYYSGIGLCSFDGSYNTYPIYVACNEDVVTFTETPTTPDGAQWKFNWDQYAQMMGIEELMAVFDLGITTEGGFCFAYDSSIMGGPGYFEYMSSPSYKIIPDPEFPDMMGTIALISYDMFGDEQTMNIQYEYYGTSCHFICPELMIDAYAEICAEPIEITLNGVM